jgi:DcmR-like sensory protein
MRIPDGGPRPKPAITRAVRASVHAVQFYETDDYLVETLTDYVGAGLEAGDAAVVIATRDHLEALATRLESLGHDLATVREEGAYVAIDAEDMLARLMIDGSINPTAFTEIVGGVIAHARGEGRSRPVRAFGEMVALLWSQENRAAAMALEELWNDLSRTMSFALVCAYPVNSFTEEDHSAGMVSGINAVHGEGTPADN